MKKRTNGWNRRDLFRASAMAGAAGALGAPAAGAAKAPVENPSVYTALGVKPFINTTATLTINGGSRQLDEVIEAVEAASRFHVNLDELMEKAGERLCQLLQCEGAMVTSGAAAALTHATAACLAGADPEAMQQLPDLTGLKDEVIMPTWSRNQYDHAIRTLGVRIVNVDTPEQLARAVSRRTAMMSMLGDRWEKPPVTLEHLAEVSRKTGIPILVDAAADPLVIPDPYLSRGATLVAYSGGKIIRGPQTAGLLLGRKDLIRAAFLNSAPHHSFGRALKVSKEEIVGMVKAVEVWVTKRNIEAEYREWESWYAHITREVTRVPGVRTRVNPPRRGSTFPTLQVEWDPQQVGITAGDVGAQLLGGEPRIMSHAAGEGFSFVIRPVALKPDEYKIVAQRVREVLESAKGRPYQPPKILPPSTNLAGRWDVDLEFVVGKARHMLVLETNQSELAGTHIARLTRGDLKGQVSGDQVRFTSTLPYEGNRLEYAFQGKIEGNRMSGEVDLGEHGVARWSAERHRGIRVTRDPSKA